MRRGQGKLNLSLNEIMEVKTPLFNDRNINLVGSNSLQIPVCVLMIA